LQQISDQPKRLDELLQLAIEKARSSRNLPESTYRLQFHAKFTFRDATAIIPYLSELGVTHVYASPYFKANHGSMHGYDVIDHCELNPELGTVEDFETFVAALSAYGMWHIADMVPNHVGIATNDNTWWNDVLENGPASLYAHYFDINWAGSPQTNLKGRVLIATLGSMYGQELEQGNLQVAFENGSFFVSYHERRFPLSPRTYPVILQDGAGELKADESTLNEYRWIVEACAQLPDRCERAAVAAERHRAVQEIKSRLAKLASDNTAIGNFIAQQVKATNGIPNQPRSFDRLDDLLRHQCFRLAFWRTAPDEINYRRFFDINDLAALAMERPEVFSATHRFILNLLAQRIVAGLRIDHPDGLYDPRTYFQRLQTHYVLELAREAAASFPVLRELPWDELRPHLLERLERMMPSVRATPSDPLLYVLGEKILAVDESVPKSWPIHGTSGYEFLNMVNGLFVDVAAQAAFDKIYQGWTGVRASSADLIYAKKGMIQEISLASELNMLAGELKRIAERSRYGIDFSFHSLHTALKQVIACFPVYRSYIDADGPSPEDVHYIEKAVACAAGRNPKTDPAIYQFIRDTLLAENGDSLSADELASRRHFAGKFQQLSSPVMAKGVEDTVFYIYNRLLSLNEVGGDPAQFGVSAQKLHAFFEQRQRNWPYSMSTLSTHDTKRSEDVRARLNVLSEMPDEWQAALQRWGDLNARHRNVIDETPAPGRNDEYALYQMLLGAWPPDASESTAFEQRVQGAMLKSMREAKLSTSWLDPDQKYEAAMHAFIETILDESRSPEFLEDFRRFHQTVSRFGAINSLSQSVIKLTAPGVPDTYQGNEILDFSLVDPDNRRPVDFAQRRRLLQELNTDASLAGVVFKVDKFCKAEELGAVKLHIHQTALKLRKQYEDLFTTGEYIPLQTSGSKAEHLFAFARSYKQHVAVAVVPRLIWSLGGKGANWPIASGVWGDTRVELPVVAQGKNFQNMLTHASIRTVQTGPFNCLAADLLAELPVALLMTV
jgi:(1->4)-alpha-D-glucan 1-alpha-D-glucosylmutase